MNKRILTVAVAALALAACSKNETVEVAASKAIGFDAFVGKVTRTVNDITTADNNLTTFYVFGGYGDGVAFTGTPNVFNNVAVTGTPFATETVQYWIANKLYSFAAYSDGNNKLEGASFTDGAFAITGYSAGENDLIYAEPDDVQTGEESTLGSMEAVGLTFDHLLSKVKFTFTTDVADGNYVEITDLKIDAVKNTADYTNGAWGTPTGDDVVKNFNVYSEGTTLAKVAVNADAESDECYVIPQANGTTLTASFTATLKDANGTLIKEKSFKDCSLATGDLSASEAGNNTWVSGFGYNYTANVTEEEIMDGNDLRIKFTVNAITDWKDVDAADTDITE